MAVRTNHVTNPSFEVSATTAWGISDSVDGTPTDCVLLAMRGLLGQRPDLLISGINHGPNSGSLLLLSQEADAWEEINYPRLDRGLYELKGIVSRKKQLLPLVSQLLAAARA